MTTDSLSLADKIALRDRLSREIAAEERAAQEERYRQTVRELGIRMEEIVWADANDYAFSSSADDFAHWLTKTGKKKRYVAWMGRVYYFGHAAQSPLDTSLALCDLDAIRAVERERKGGA